ncbi:MAG: tetratricopeptide repeat protein [Myxococcales bacterium]|nr:tetratricopeptide repeat protein [Myxococcales bacterium]MBK7193352.1 tetratricopeptide repeat protein [Myxococcales bacterium]MBP6848867.1 tetratricopeptide repeat protein [Kofleriaceae bacterium]
MTELYSVRDVARLFALQESRLRYWMQTGFVGPTVRKGGRFYYTFRDLCAVKAAKDLLAAGLSAQKVRKNLEALRRALPGDAHPALRLRLCSDGESIVALADDVAFTPSTGQVVMAFNLPALGGQIVESLASAPAPSLDDAIPGAIGDEPTEANLGPTAYTCFVEACAAEDRGDAAEAEALYRRALDIDPGLAAAMTNLGNLRHRGGDLAEARALYEQALAHDPGQTEARYNLGNLLDDSGETELAIAELRRVCQAAPEFADAHYNLGLALARVGGASQARRHLERYLELDDGSEWAGRAREYLTQLAA